MTRLRRDRDIGPPDARPRSGARAGRRDRSRSLAVGAQLLAALGAGLLAEVIGLRATAFLAPLGGLLAAAVLVVSPVRVLRELPVMDDRSPAEVVDGSSGISRSAPDAGSQAKSASTNASGSNGEEVVDALPHPDEADRDLERVLDGEDDAALGGRVELGQDDPGQARPPRGTPSPGPGRSGRSSRRARTGSRARRRAGACRRCGGPWSARPSGSTSCAGARPCRR